MVKQKVLIGISLCSLLVLSGCVSEQTYVGSDKPVSDRSFDNIEAARTRISLGLNYLRRGDTSQAKYNLERARSFAPNSAEVYSALAYYYQSVDELKQAEEYFRLSISKDSNYADAYNNFGAFLCQLNRYEESEELLLKAISRPGYIRVAESYENLALCQLQQNNFVKANRFLDSSISHNSTRISSLTMLAAVSYAMGDNRQAKTQLDRIQRLGRVSATTVLLSYLIADKNGDRETLRNAEQLLLTLYSDTPEARLLLQGKLQDSEFERLRERYKDSLMANIVLPEDDAVKAEVPEAPVANPKLKIVRRKNDSGQTDNVAVAQATPRSQPAKAGAEPAALKNATSDIANSLGGVTQTAVAELANVDVLPDEKVNVDNTYDKQIVDAQQAEQEAAALLVLQEQQREQAEQDAAVLALQEQQRLQAEQDAALLVLQEQQREQAEQDAAVLALQEQQRLQAEQDAAVLALQEQQRLQAEQDAAVLAVQEQQRLQAEQDATAWAVTEKDNLQTEPLQTQTLQTEPDVLAQTEQSDTTADTESMPSVDASISEDLESATAKSQTQMQEDERATVPDSEQAVATEVLDLPNYHIVQSAESLYAISVQHNIRLQRLMDWNKLTPDSVIKTGQKIWLGPVSEEQLNEQPATARVQIVASEPMHIVAEGETMFGISYRYNVRLSSFLSWNNLSENSKLQVGQQVYVIDPESVNQ
ncbi:type IV pilus biogenesis/stability protein PilW [Rheinheimera baltica]|uniref:Type IV pilus biogenesis/stability protein PilW n=1 Tax=Rheinheimera baltica TaxID=67576 RepID=A0ABT9HY71_9GAMM|nr:type IV pilus biogenesis/stability protein PilW [Rheinheimera baltica]MDP5136078.1 type IV pilus biogenesis/stability protein PilW [Rheinheimera baltica]